MSVCLTMIVKNEAHVIERCLNSIKDYIDYWVICDTGSTDGTQTLINNIMKDIPGILLEHKWIDFSTNRNKALATSKKMADYVLIIDADEIFIVKDKNVFKNLSEMNYSIPINYCGLKYSRTQLINQKSDAEYKGVVHEAIISKYPSIHLSGLEIESLGGGGRANDPNTYKKDAALLQKEVNKNPLDTRSVFYLAQSYRDCGELEKAIYYYNKRFLLGGWEEELYIAQYQIGKCYERLDKNNEAIINYLCAYNFRPTRIEAIYNLAVLCRNLKLYQVGYLFAKKGIELPFSKDILFVEKNVHNYLMLFELSLHEYWIGKYEDAINSCKKLMEIPNVPENILNQNKINIQFSIDKLKK